ncbi:cation:proton antiporter [Pseudochryseolinea flava]|uniref:Cation/H(+) antiporter n=1 Tax=Pseudochryseolinea flava TaxID=2059302 RepID=A0A364Y7A0_9BACT|nr:cation:proton antiporter [Pseudochryseolinea flava]RAW02773.1 cation/H(+) antiporter [Pseudochryseolinea flava]
MTKKLLFYLILIGVFGGLIYWVTIQGSLLESQKAVSDATQIKGDYTPFEMFQDTFHHNLVHPLARLILQIISIILISRIFGFIFNKIGQPTVIGEIIAGIVLGPSVLGMFFPEFSLFLFPQESLGNLQFLSQVGLILFMFVIGLELDLKILRGKANDAVVISHASIIIPYFLGMLLAYFLYEEFAPANISYISFSLFMGIAMSITAFPVLARVIQERDLTKTRLGIIAITCAAADDVTAWCILAAVIAIVKAGTFVSALYTIALALGYVLFMLFVIQPFLKRIGTIYSDRETISKTIVAVAFLVLLISSYLAEIIGIHALFGAFLAGVIMPPSFSFRKILTEKIEDVSLVLLLPLFFVFTGLRTQIGLLNESHLWITCGWIILTAVVGKFGGSTLAARVVGTSWRESLAIGALMNTRGLMELIVLNIGFDLGVLSPPVFAMLVLMALVTTFMTGPALDLINYFYPERDGETSSAAKLYKILISFGPPLKGKILLRLADQITHKKKEEAAITAFHLTPSADINPKEAREYELESFKLVKQEADQLKIDITTLYRATNDISKEITTQANRGKYDLLLVGGSKSLFSADVLGGKVKDYLEDVHCQIGVFVDKDFDVADKILVPLQDNTDLYLISFAERFIQNNNAKVVLYDRNRLLKTNMIFSMAVEKINTEYADSISVLESHQISGDYLKAFNLVMMSYGQWKDFSRQKTSWINYTPSVLILKSQENT